MPTKSSTKTKIIISVLIVALLITFVFFLRGTNYLLTSMLIAVFSCLPFYYKYEQRKPDAREIIVVAVICAIAVVSRILFAFIPGFSPIVAIIIVAGATLGKETGFMCGSLSALLSNMFFGQGPWSVYQMLLWGIIGYLAGVMNKKHWLDNLFFRCLFAIICGIMFSFFIDFLTALSSGYTNAKFAALLVAALPFMVYYALSNLIFILFLYKPFVKKLERVKLKYGLVDEKYRV